MKYSHIPFSINIGGKNYYTNQKYALKLGKTLGKQVLRRLIDVPYTNWDMRIDPYTNRKTIQKNLDGEPKRLSTRIVQIYGYYLMGNDIKSSSLSYNEIHISLSNMINVYYKVKKEQGYLYDTCKEIITRNTSSSTCFAFIFDLTGDIFMNLKVIKKHFFHEDFYHNICSCLSHEVFHSVLLKEHGEQCNKDWDNIAMNLELQGYLGGSPLKEKYNRLLEEIIGGEI